MISSGSENQDLNLQPASFQKRLWASALDFVLCGFLSLLLAGVAMIVVGSSFILFPLFILIFIISYFANTLLYQMRTGRTFGKYVLGLKVCYPNYKVDTRNEDIIKREFAKIFTLVTCGYSFFLKYKEEEIIAFHDEYSKTVVLNLPEEHEEYLYEYHYETYFHSQDEEEEYLQAKKEAEELRKQQLEEEKRQKELEKQEKKQQKKEGKSGQPATPSTNKPSFQQPNFVAMNPNDNQSNNQNVPSQMGDMGMSGFDSEQVSPSFGQESQVSPSFSEGYQEQPITQQPQVNPSQSEQPTQPMYENHQNEMNTYQQQPQMDTNPQQMMGQPDSSGIHIVGNYDFLDNNQNKGNADDKKGFGKLSKLFSSKNDNKDNPGVMQQHPEQPLEYYDHKMSDLVQDTTYLPSQNIFSEYYKGWSVKTDAIQKGNNIANSGGKGKSKKAK